jgi:hypothetical protein
MRSFGLTVAALSLLASMRISAAADTGAALPFTPPAKWQAMPAAIIPTTPIAWVEGHSFFGITKVSSGLPAGQLTQMLKMGAAALGTVLQTNSPSVCGEPAARVVVRGKTSQILTEQAQTLEGATYVSLYVRPASTVADPAIVAVMANSCVSKAIDRITPPSGWRAYHAQIIGLWLGPTLAQTLTAISTDPQSDAQSLAQEAATTTLKVPIVTIVSHKAGSLCGHPAFFWTARTKPPNGSGEVEIQLASTQSSSVAYVLVYAHPAATPADPAASASLMTLCAAPDAARPATTSPAAAPLTSPVPAVPAGSAIPTAVPSPTR